MKLYLASLAAGLLVGIIYGVLNVRSPAPPVVALVGLLGILLGEQLPPLIKQWRQLPTAQSAGLDKQMRPPLIKRWWLLAEARTAWLDEQVKPHCFGQLPGASVNSTTTSDVKNT
ncbi:MAG: XapX domain-containing protein [Burkholderiaceae bacterium]|nr:XapX domain-containing protein [Burkholderiaceae bacterium]